MPSFFSATVAEVARSRASYTAPNVPEPRHRPTSKRSSTRGWTGGAEARPCGSGELSSTTSVAGPSFLKRASELVDHHVQRRACGALLRWIDVPVGRAVLAVDPHHAELARRRVDLEERQRLDRARDGDRGAGEV